jgi:hypothetical protein
VANEKDAPSALRQTVLGRAAACHRARAVALATRDHPLSEHLEKPGRCWNRKINFAPTIREASACVAHFDQVSNDHFSEIIERSPIIQKSAEGLAYLCCSFIQLPYYSASTISRNWKSSQSGCPFNVRTSKAIPLIPSYNASFPQLTLFFSRIVELKGPRPVLWPFNRRFL